MPRSARPVAPKTRAKAARVALAQLRAAEDAAKAAYDRLGRAWDRQPIPAPYVLLSLSSARLDAWEKAIAERERASRRLYLLAARAAGYLHPSEALRASLPCAACSGRGCGRCGGRGREPAGPLAVRALLPGNKHQLEVGGTSTVHTAGRLRQVTTTLTRRSASLGVALTVPEGATVDPLALVELLGEIVAGIKRWDGQYQGLRRVTEARP